MDRAYTYGIWFIFSIGLIGAALAIMVW